VAAVLAIYFNSTRLAMMSIFLGLTYGYATLTVLLPELRTRSPFSGHYYNSQILLPLLIPLNLLALHFTGKTGVFSRGGMAKIGGLVFEFILLFALFPTVSSTVFDLFELIPERQILGGRLNLPFLSVGLAVCCFGIMKYFSDQNYYSNYLSLLLWVIVTAQLAFVSGTSWMVNSFPMHYALFFSGAAIILNAKVLNLAWGKAYRDQLTQVPGRMALDEYLLRLSGQYAICMIDIDNFKDFNDTYGHDAGDKVLKSVAQIIQHNSSGRAYRFGGEEFTIVYSGRESEQVEEELESLRKAVSDNKVKVTRKSKRATKELEKKVTISLGLADSTGKYDNPKEVLNAADNALFTAKEEGRNQLVVKN
jgi:diguanylate cyclase (GGDEF)-like protein